MSSAANFNLDNPSLGLGNFQLPQLQSFDVPGGFFVPPPSLYQPVSFQEGLKNHQLSLLSPQVSSALPSDLSSTLSFGSFVHSEPNPASSALQLTADTVSEVAPRMPKLGIAASALSLGSTLHESTKNIQKQLDAGKSPTETIVCETARAGAETIVGTLGGSLITGGIPAYLSEVAAFPPLAATIPVVGAALPQAYANMGEIAQAAGRQTEAACHSLFSAAQSLSSNGENK